MRNKADLSHALHQQKRKHWGKESFYFKMTPEEAKLASTFCDLEPHLFEIKRTFRAGFDPKTASGVVKSVYYAKRSPVYKQLSAKQRAQCEVAGLKPVPYKYKIRSDSLR